MIASCEDVIEEILGTSWEESLDVMVWWNSYWKTPHLICPHVLTIAGALEQMFFSSRFWMMTFSQVTMKNSAPKMWPPTWLPLQRVKTWPFTEALETKLQPHDGSLTHLLQAVELELKEGPHFPGRFEDVWSNLDVKNSSFCKTYLPRGLWNDISPWKLTALAP